MRMLIHQHTLLFEPDADHNTNRIGMIDPACKLKSVIMEAFQNAAFLCEEYYNCAPDVEIKGQTMTKNEKGKKVGLSLVYPPPHLYHILFELFKNSMRATVETHKNVSELPEIEVLLAKGEHDVSIRISDQGGGIPRHITDATFHGWGTDAVVYLKSLTHEAHELLPVFNKTSAKHYKTAIPTADWMDPTFTMTTASCYRPSNSSKPWSTSR